MLAFGRGMRRLTSRRRKQLIGATYQCTNVSVTGPFRRGCILYTQRTNSKCTYNATELQAPCAASPKSNERHNADTQNTGPLTSQTGTRNAHAAYTQHSICIHDTAHHTRTHSIHSIAFACMMQPITHAHTHAHTRTHTVKRSHTHSHARTHAHTHVHTHLWPHRQPRRNRCHSTHKLSHQGAGAQQVWDVVACRQKNYNTCGMRTKWKQIWAVNKKQQVRDVVTCVQKNNNTCGMRTTWKKVWAVDKKQQVCVVAYAVKDGNVFE